ncbi:MAG: PAS domain S-box protein [bacterium]
MSHKSLRILFVHDAIESRREFRELISKTDFAQVELDYVTTDLAFQAFHRSHYGVCVIDSPAKGIWTLQDLRRADFATPIIVLTCNSAYEVIKAMHHGAADCLVKETLTAEALEESICVVMEEVRYKEYKAELARRYLGLAENSGEVIYTHDLKGYPTFLSKAGEQLIGYTVEEFRNANFYKVLTPDCFEFVWGSVLHMLAHRKPSSYEAVIVNKDGQRIPVGVTMHLVYSRGKPVEVQGIVRDLRSQIPVMAQGSRRTVSEQVARVVYTL